MSAEETPPPPFDLEQFRADFVKCLDPNKPAEAAIQMMVDVIQQNPDRVDEICKTASTALRAAARQQPPAAEEMPYKTETAPEDQLRAALKEILHHILDSVKEDNFRRGINKLGHKSSWANLNSWIAVENCENGFGPPNNRSHVDGLMTKLLIKGGADDTYGPYCGLQVEVEKPDSKLHTLIIVKLIYVGGKDIVEIFSHSVDGFATVVGPIKDSVENHDGDYRVYIDDVNPEEWDVANKKTL